MAGQYQASQGALVAIPIAVIEVPARVSCIRRLIRNLPMKGARFYPLLLILAGLALGACANAKPTSQPAITVVLAPKIPGAVSSEVLAATRRVVQERLNMVIGAPTRVTDDGSNIRVEISSGKDVSFAAHLAGKTGIIEFWDSPTPMAAGSTVPSVLVPVMNGLDIAQAHVERAQTGGAWQVIIRFTPTGAQKMAQFTASHVGKYLVLSQDREVVAALLIQSPISGGEAVISSALTEVEAKALAAVMNSGALPIPLTVVSVSVAR
ncbi:MAG: hypothetical protein M1546_23175 [Chloroflexi bacterium]|nr:hypothetical protein [Chloroflexota bacterium]